MLVNTKSLETALAKQTTQILPAYTAEELQIAELRLGYTFQDKGLLALALSSSKFGKSCGLPDNELLEFLGDAVMEVIFCASTFSATGGDFRRAEHTMQLTNKTLAAIADDMGLASVIKPYNDIPAKARPDALEAVIAAAYLDSGFRGAATVMKRAQQRLYAALELCSNPHPIAVPERMRWWATKEYDIIKRRGHIEPLCERWALSTVDAKLNLAEVIAFRQAILPTAAPIVDLHLTARRMDCICVTSKPMAKGREHTVSIPRHIYASGMGPQHVMQRVRDLIQPFAKPTSSSVPQLGAAGLNELFDSLTVNAQAESLEVFPGIAFELREARAVGGSVLVARAEYPWRPEQQADGVDEYRAQLHADALAFWKSVVQHWVNSPESGQPEPLSMDLQTYMSDNKSL